jgi:hypothetical protein
VRHPQGVQLRPPSLINQLPCPPPTISFGLLSDRIAPFLSAVCFFRQLTGVVPEYRTRLTVLGSENYGQRRNGLQSQRAVGMLDYTCPCLNSERLMFLNLSYNVAWLLWIVRCSESQLFC